MYNISINNNIEAKLQNGYLYFKSPVFVIKKENRLIFEEVNITDSKDTDILESKIVNEYRLSYYDSPYLILNNHASLNIYGEFGEFDQLLITATDYSKIQFNASVNRLTVKLKDNADASFLGDIHHFELKAHHRSIAKLDIINDDFISEASGAASVTGITSGNVITLVKDIAHINILKKNLENKKEKVEIKSFRNKPTLNDL